MTRPFRNCRLTQIAGQGFSEDYGRPAGAGSAKWTGDEDAYLTQRSVEQPRGQQLDQLTETLLYIPPVYDAATGSDIDLLAGDTVTFLHAGGSVDRVVESVARDEALGEIRIVLRQS